MMETTLSMMRLPLSVFSMTACLSDSAKSVWVVWSCAVCCVAAIICSDYRGGGVGCQGGMKESGDISDFSLGDFELDGNC